MSPPTTAHTSRIRPLTQYQRASSLTLPTETVDLKDVPWEKAVIFVAKKIFIAVRHGCLCNVEFFHLQTVEAQKSEFPDRKDKNALFRESVNKRTAEGHCALHLACECGYYQIVDFLLRNGANVNQREAHPWALTPVLSVLIPLQYVTRSCMASAETSTRLQIIQRLLQEPDVDLRARNASELDARRFAKSLRQAEMARRSSRLATYFLPRRVRNRIAIDRSDDLGAIEQLLSG